jgi:transcriptional regulator GlxA family with amidase domain/DNA-directed RNA polymerase subunit RPC12/RpoP
MKNLLLLVALLLFNSGCTQKKGAHVATEKTVFVCPPCGGSCDDLTFDQAGKCPHCGMKLVNKASLILENNTQELSICFYLQDNVEVLDFAGPLEVFRVAGFKVFTVSKTKEKITSEGCLTILPEYSIADAPKADVMVFFGGLHGDPSNDPELINWIKSRIKATRYFMSVCTGAFIMGKAGILDGLTATTYHTQIEALTEAFPNTKVLENVRFVDNGDVICTAGISAGIDGALHFIAKIKGVDFAKQVAEDIEYDKWIPENGLVIKE